MIFTETRLKGAYAIDLELRSDERGFFARSYCWREFEAHGLNPVRGPVQCFLQPAARHAPGHALSGMARIEEAKLIRCARGALYDVIVDLRPIRRRSGNGSAWN